MAANASPETIGELTRQAEATNLHRNAPSLASGGPPGPSELDASKLTYKFTTSPRTVPTPNSREVWSQGEATDHMITARWTAPGGWEAPKLVPYGPFEIWPTASVLHYATECFEGLKLYRGHDGRARLFRPDKNALRMLGSTARISLPAFPTQQLVQLIHDLAAVDAPRWLPAERKGSFLYVRPTMIATTQSVAVKKPDEALLYILLLNFPSFDDPAGSLGPHGTYGSNPASTATSSSISSISSSSSSGPPPPPPPPPAKPKRAGVRLFASEDDTIRAWPGGFGNAKLGANYGPSLVASAAAAAKGYDQILWLFGPEGWVTEAGASNFFAVVKDAKSSGGRRKLLTAPLDDSIILPGVTRTSVLDAIAEFRSAAAAEEAQASKDADADADSAIFQDLDVEERRFSIHELIAAADEGRLVECFASGTAFFISAIGEIHYRGRDIEVPLGTGEDSVMGDLAKRLRQHLSGIMYGQIRDHPWGYKIEETGVRG